MKQAKCPATPVAVGERARTQADAMRITKQTGYAIRILIDCAMADGALVKVADVSKRLGITKPNVFKIVHVLSRTGFVGAVRGPSGGVRLAKPASEIKIGDVVRAIEVTNSQVARDAANDGLESRSLHSVFDDAFGAFISVLDQHTLADLASAHAPLVEKTTSRKGKGGASRRA